MAFDVAMFLACFHVWSIKGCCLLSSSKAKMSSVSDLRRSLEHCFLSYSQNKINQWIIIFFVSSLITRNIMKIEKSKNYQKISNTLNLYGWYENKISNFLYSPIESEKMHLCAWSLRLPGSSTSCVSTFRQQMSQQNIFDFTTFDDSF